MYILNIVNQIKLCDKSAINQVEDQIIPQDSEAVHKSGLHLLFPVQASRSQYKCAIQLTVPKNLYNLVKGVT